MSKKKVSPEVSFVGVEGLLFVTREVPVFRQYQVAVGIAVEGLPVYMAPAFGERTVEHVLYLLGDEGPEFLAALDAAGEEIRRASGWNPAEVDAAVAAAARVVTSGQALAPAADLLTYEQAAAILRVNRSRVNALISAGRLERVVLDGRTTRVTRGSLDAYLAARRGPGRPPSVAP